MVEAETEQISWKIAHIEGMMKFKKTTILK